MAIVKNANNAMVDLYEAANKDDLHRGIEKAVMHQSMYRESSKKLFLGFAGRQESLQL